MVHLKPNGEQAHQHGRHASHPKHNCEYGHGHLGSGASKVPCLKITEAYGETRWLQDSKAIVAHLRERFENPAN